MYCLDTNCFIQGFQRYPPVIFPDLWDRLLPDLARDERAVSPVEVLNELKKRDDDVFAWGKDHRHMFRPIDEEIQREMVQLVNRYPRLLGAGKGRNAADPWVIALAKIENRDVVTYETRSTKIETPKIPDVCDAKGIETIDLIEIVRREGWSFRSG